jgi:hypothetical protein
MPGERHPGRRLLSYLKYYNERTHLSMEKDAQMSVTWTGPDAFLAGPVIGECIAKDLRA